MNGISEVCQFPHCAKKAAFCCSRCLKRTYCSEQCQALDWECHKKQCIENEKREEIIKDIIKATEKYGKAVDYFKSSETIKQMKQLIEKPEEKNAKTSSKANENLLPYSVIVLNKCIADLFESLQQHKTYGKYFSRKKRDLFHTSSVMGTSNILQTVLNHINSDPEFIQFDNREVSESITGMQSLLCELAFAFNQPQLGAAFQSLNFYAVENDYTYEGPERHFCTLCGEKENLKEHPRMQHVFFCQECLEGYEENEWEQEDGHDMVCYCCGDGGNVVLCDTCTHSICSTCILLHMGVEEWEKVLNEERWECLLCKKDENGKAIFKK